jgi:hypothetical protein
MTAGPRLASNEAARDRQDVARAVGGLLCTVLLVLLSVGIVCALIASLWSGGWMWLRGGALELVEVGAGAALFFAAVVGFSCSLQGVAAAADRIIAGAELRSRAVAVRRSQGSAAVPALAPHGRSDEATPVRRSTAQEATDGEPTTRA